MRSRVLIIASERELPSDRRIWGTGGWLQPHQREALDWLTLFRLLGWETTVAKLEGRGISPSSVEGFRWIILAADPDSVGEALASMLKSSIDAHPALVIARTPAEGTPLANLTGVARGSERVAGRDLRWTGALGESAWHVGKSVTASSILMAGDVSTWATVDGAPLVAARRGARGTVATLTAHPGEMRDAGGGGTALLRRLLTGGVEGAVAWLDFEGMLVLRMDDPGGSQNVHSKSWHYTKISEAGWGAVAEDLSQRKGRLSVLYTPGWMDDGDARRGSLTVAGSSAPRVSGMVHPSPHVIYKEMGSSGTSITHDYPGEFRGLQALRAAGLGDVELHGYTHVHPDVAAWAASADRYDNVSWFRELGHSAAAAIAKLPADEHPVRLGIATLRRYFDVSPTTLVSPGDEWTNEALEVALDSGIQLVDSYYLALRHDNRFCWSTHVVAPYLDKPASAWFDAALPVVGYLHDREVALEGVAWMSRLLDRWEEAGARRLIDFRELAGALGRSLHMDGVGPASLRVDDADGPPLVRPMPVAFRSHDGRLPAQLPAIIGGVEVSLAVRDVGAGVGRVEVPLYTARRLKESHG